jgi:glycogen phosphorylase
MLYLLDANDLLNSAADRGLTSELYGGGPEARLQQEIILGIGGWRVLRTLGIEPDICHLNEGHAAFAGLERARCFMEDNGVDFERALVATRAGNVFTTHTPVEAGFDRFPKALIEEYLGDYVQELGISTDRLLSLGADQDQGTFNMAYLAIRSSGGVNGVSRLHGEVSRRLFQPLFPRWPESDIPVGHVTNGVHVPSWDSPESDDLWTKLCGKEGGWVTSPAWTNTSARRATKRCGPSETSPGGSSSPWPATTCAGRAPSPAASKRSAPTSTACATRRCSPSASPAGSPATSG